MSKEIKRHQEEERQLRCLPIWSWYIKGARMMLLRLREHYLCEEPHSIKATKDGKIYNKAILDLIMDSKGNVDKFLSQDYDEIRYTDHEHDKRGRLVKCRAFFAKRVISYKEV